MTECAEDYLPLDLVDDLGPDYDIDAMKFGLQLFGESYGRTRASVESHKTELVIHNVCFGATCSVCVCMLFILSELFCRTA